MPYITVGKENVANIDIYDKDCGRGQPIVFSHGWPLSADDWDAQMLFFLGKGFRVIAQLYPDVIQTRVPRGWVVRLPFE